MFWDLNILLIKNLISRLTFRLCMWYESSNQIIVDNFNNVINTFIQDKSQVFKWKRTYNY